MGSNRTLPAYAYAYGGAVAVADGLNTPQHSSLCRSCVDRCDTMIE